MTYSILPSMSDFGALGVKLPSLVRLLEKQGSLSLFEYAQKHYHGIESIDPLFHSRKQELLHFLQIYVTERFGNTFGDLVVDTLQSNYAVSTAEHHGPMGHPFFFQSALLRAIVQPDLAVINFATSHVSLGNSSYPRGLVFHGDGEDAPQNYLHLPFFGSKSRMCPVFYFPAYTQNDIETHCIERLKTYKRLGYISESLYTKIYDFIQEHVLETSILGFSTYSEQITLLNHRWWKSLFPTLPVALSLDAEDIVAQLLQRHLHDDTFFAGILTDISLQPSIEEYFDDISCCFNLKQRQGTYLFWYLDDTHRRHALWRDGDELVTADKLFRMKMNHKEYFHHFTNNRLIPSGLLVYSMFACYYGVTCFGGFAQGEYLPEMQLAFQKLHKDSVSLSTQGSTLNENMIFLLQKNGEISTAVDMYVTGEKKDTIESIYTVSLNDSLYTMKHEIGRCL